MAPHVAKITEIGQQFPNDCFCPPTVRALEVAVLDEGHRGVRRPANVIVVRIDGIGQVHDCGGLAEERPGTKSRRQSSRNLEHQPGEQGRRHGGGEHSEGGLLQLDSRKRDRSDEQRDGEAHPGQGAAS